MRRGWIGLGFLVANVASASVQYVLDAQTYATTTDFTAPCATGPCQNFPPTGQPTGSFTTASALPPNLVFQNILPLVTSFSFTDGVNAFVSGDPNLRAFDFSVQTDASGNILTTSIFLELWETGTSPHAVGDRFSYLQLNAPPSAAGVNNAACVGVGPSAQTGVTDACQLVGPDASTSTGTAAADWRIVVQVFSPVPVASGWGAALLSVLLLAAGLAAPRLRRARRES